jgi:hypothetical protein
MWALEVPSLQFAHSSRSECLLMYSVAICRLQIFAAVETGQDVNDSEFKFDNEPTATGRRIRRDKRSR